MAWKKPAKPETELVTSDVAEAPSAPKRVRLKNTNPANGTVGDIATPLAADAAAWRAIGWADAD
jgi:hypothetical protein